MISEQKLIEKWRKLPPVKQQQIVDFVERLESQKLDANVQTDQTIPTIEIWSPYESNAAAQDLMKLIEADPGEDCA